MIFWKKRRMIKDSTVDGLIKKNEVKEVGEFVYG